jgi:hypothetical protein
MKPPQPPKFYRGYRIERYSVAFQVLYRGIKGEEKLSGAYGISELKQKIDRHCDQVAT